MKNLKVPSRIFMAVFIAAIGFSKMGFSSPSTEGVFDTAAPFVLDADVGILVGDGDALPGADLQVKKKLQSSFPLYLGGEFGFFVDSSTNSAVVIPVLASLSTVFDASPRVHPVIGVSVGPTFATGGGWSAARMTMLLNPGLNIDLGRTWELNALVRFGALGSTFVGLPQIGLTFAI